jgi:hypothetical protein
MPIIQVHLFEGRTLIRRGIKMTDAVVKAGH